MRVFGLTASVNPGESVALAANFKKNGNILETNTSQEFSFGHNVDGVVV